MDTGEKIRSKREKARLSQAELAKLAGTSQQTIDRLERGVTDYSRFLPKIFEVLEIDDIANPMPRFPPIEADGEILIKSIVEDDGTDVFLMTELNAGAFPRPRTLQNASGVYAIYMHGVKMAPIYRSGDLLVINPHQPPRNEDGAVFLSADRTRLQIAELEKETATEWTIKRYGPKPVVSSIKKKDFPICEVVHAVFKRR